MWQKLFKLKTLDFVHTIINFNSVDLFLNDITKDKVEEINFN